MVSVNVQLPNEMIKTFGDKITFKQIEDYVIRKRIKKLEEKYYNKKEDNYGVFENSLKAIKFLTRNRLD